MTRCADPLAGLPVPADRIPAAAIVHVAGAPADALLAAFAFGLRRAGWRVRGIVQQREGVDKWQTMLVDVETGQRYPLFQRLGSGSRACSLDAGGVIAASVVLREALAQDSDLTVANRFGALEAEGGGLAPEMLALMSEQRPLLTIVAPDKLPAWRRFTGGCGVELAPRREALDDWFAQVAPTRPTTGSPAR